ncbi:helix-turn-helix domain-containing protein [Pseudomonas sp. HK3]
MSNNKEDMHPADVMAALKKNGFSMTEVARRAGYKYPGTLRQALYRPFPKGQRIIAAAMQMKPEDVWPSRYSATSKADDIEIPHRSVA